VYFLSQFHTPYTYEHKHTWMCTTHTSTHNGILVFNKICAIRLSCDMYHYIHLFMYSRRASLTMAHNGINACGIHSTHAGLTFTCSPHSSILWAAKLDGCYEYVRGGLTSFVCARMSGTRQSVGMHICEHVCVYWMKGTPPSVG
jgi:hypothetical protein